jgi:hypothetical protein
MDALYKCELVRIIRAMLRAPKSRRGQIAILILVTAVFIPFPTLATPAWRVWVTGPDGKPAQRALVRLSWQNYSAEDRSHEEAKSTDETGFVEFSPHKTWASVAQRVFFTLKSATALAHASFGPNAYVSAMKDNWQADDVKHGVEYFWTGKPAVVESRLKPRNENARP